MISSHDRTPPSNPRPPRSPRKRKADAPPETLRSTPSGAPSSSSSPRARPEPEPAPAPLDPWHAKRERQAREYQELVREYKAMVGTPRDEASLAALLMHGLGVANDDPITDLLVGVQSDLEALANLVSRADDMDPFCTKLVRLSRQVEVVLQLYWREGALRLPSRGAP